MKRYLFLTVTLVLFFSLAVNAFAATYYIDGTIGDDGKSGTTSSPWKTIEKANSTLQPGDTVFIRAGKYSQTIFPKNSGRPGQYITYNRYEQDEVTITNVKYGASLSSKSYIIIDGIRFYDLSSSWIVMDSATHCIIRNCHMEESGSWSGIKMHHSADYNQILNNTLIGYDGPNDLILCWDSRYNLFEGNDFQYGLHNSLNFQGRGRSVTGNVVRNNTFWNPWHSGLALWKNAPLNLVEGNTIYDCGSDHENCTNCPETTRNKPFYKHAGIQLGASGNIVRRNVMMNNGSMNMNAFDELTITKDNRIYHNTFYKNYRGMRTVSTHEISGNVIKNNVFYDNRDYELQFVPADRERDVNTYSYNNLLGANIKYKSVNDGSRAEVESKYPSEWENNINANPNFVDVAKLDLHLNTGSPMINAGEFLTRTRSSGSGYQIPVDDASYFSDGFGIIDGDLIQLKGQTVTAKIVSIDYKSNIITIDRALSWNAGDGLTLPYSGSAPDIGAYEYQSTDQPLSLSPPTRLSIVEK
jgi:parallel beta helix pectate lyase-like protein